METHSLRVNRPTPALPGQPGKPTNVCVKWPASNSSPPSPHTPHVLVVVFKAAGEVRGWWWGEGSLHLLKLSTPLEVAWG